MSLSKRLGKVAEQRASEPAPLEVLELPRSRTGGVGVDVTGESAAIDLRAPGAADRAPARPAARVGSPSRFALRRQRLEQRDAKLAQQLAMRRPAVEAPPCPRCGTASRIDIDDRTRGTLHLSCDNCFNMWQAPGTPPVSPA